MEITIVDSFYRVTDIIDEFESCIWTERFTDAGDFKLVLPATRENIRKLRPKTFVRNDESRDIMIIDTREVNAGLLTVSGKSLDIVLDNQGIPRNSSQATTGALTLTGTPGEIITTLVERTNATIPQGNFFVNALVEIGEQDHTGAVATEVVSPGSLYSQILPIAKKYNVGLSLRPAADNLNNPFAPPNFIFKTYRGLDRTRYQRDRDFLLFSPYLDNFQGAKELLSIADAVEEVRVYPPEALRDYFETQYPFKRGFVEVIRGFSLGGNTGSHHSWLTKRSEIVAENVKMEMIGSRGDGKPTLMQLMREAGRRELEARKKVHAIDGEIIVPDDLKYGRDFHLGDRVEIDDNTSTGGTIVAMLSEFIRSSDTSGERAYPTLVIPQDPPEAEYGYDGPSQQ